MIPVFCHLLVLVVLMAKRRSNKELTHDNWDEEDEETEVNPGSGFNPASSKEIATRKIAVAKRRTSSQGSGGSTGTSTFAGFAGFSARSPPGKAGGDVVQATPRAAVFGAQLTAAQPLFTSTPLMTAGSGNATHEQATSGGKVNGTRIASGDSTTATATAMEGKRTRAAVDCDEQFRADLRSLNEATLNWCRQHFDENPYIDLSPVFADYSKYLGEIDEKYVNGPPISSGGTSNAEKEKCDHPQSVVTTNPPEHTQHHSNPASFFGNQKLPSSTTGPSPREATAEQAKKEASDTASRLFFPAVTKSDPATLSVTATSTPLFSFAPAGSSIFAPATGSLFSNFGQNATRSPVSITTHVENANGEGGEEDDDGKPYEPPKAEVVDQAEKDAFFSIRCKMFYMKEKKYEERGVGVLSLKKVDETSSRVQLIIRAATNLGAVMLNVMLTAEMKPVKSGKNNVQLCCVPNPPLKDVSGLAMILIRVKTEEDADLLLSKLAQHQPS